MDLSYALDYPVITGTSPQQIHMLVRMETWPEEGGAARKPINLGLVLDRSGSMAGGKLAATKEAASALVRRLGPQDILTIVTYDSRVDVILPPSQVTDVDLINRCIQSIGAGGVTNLSAGWIRGLSLISEHANPQMLNRVLLLTDGQANEGVTDEQSLVEIARQYYQEQITTTTLGFGEGFNEDILTAIAREGGGHFYFIESQEQAGNAFLKEFGELTRIFGQNCELTLTPGAEIPMPTLLGNIPAFQTPQTVSVKIGDVRDQDHRQFIFFFDLADEMGAQTRELATITVCYDAVRGKVGARRHILSAKFRVDPGQSIPEPVAAVHQEIILLRVSQLKKETIDSLDRGDLGGAQNCIQQAQSLLQKYNDLAPDRFDREIANLHRLVQATDLGDSVLRKHLSSQIYDFTSQRGTYQCKPHADVKTYSFTPQTPEVVAEIVAYMHATLKSYDYKQNSIENLEFAFREIAENAIEHGVKGLANPRCVAELHLARNYARISVSDNGSGFDLEAVLKREEQQAKREAMGELKGKRGRGLFAVRKMVDTLTANSKGNAITVAIRKERFAASTNFDIVMDAQGVGEVAVVKVSGFLDTNSYGKIEDMFQAVLAKGIYKVIVDLSECDYISSCGAGALMGAITAILDNHGSMVLVSPASNVKRTLDCLGLADIFPMASSIEEAKRLM